MGEAKRRREQLARLVLPDDLKDDIAESVRSIILDISSGSCGWRALIGGRLLCSLGLPANIVAGGVIYRAGPDPRRDVVPWCGPGNLGMNMPGGGIIGHFYLELGSEFIDFSAGDWRHLMTPEFAAEFDDLGAVQWDVPPPAYFWLPKRSVAPVYPPSGWRPDDPETFTPKLGQVWYTGWRGDKPNIGELIAALPWEMIDRHLERCRQSYNLPARIQRADA